MFLIVYLSIKTCFLTNLNTDLYHVRGAPYKKKIFLMVEESGFPFSSHLSSPGSS